MYIQTLNRKRIVTFENVCFTGTFLVQTVERESGQRAPHVVHQCVKQIRTHVQGLKCMYSACSNTHTQSENTVVPRLDSDHNVLTLSRALSLPCLLNSMWKHNEQMTGLTTLTSKLLHQCFHPLAFSFSTHHFPLLCNWETMTTSESSGWSYMKEAEGVEPTVMWLAPSPRTLGCHSSHFFFFFFFWRFSLIFFFLPSRSLFCFL